jgi:hypothetical protein
VRCGFELVDEGLCLFHRELATGLTLGEAHGAACVAEVAVAGVGQQLEECLDLTVRSGWS